MSEILVGMAGWQHAPEVARLALECLAEEGALEPCVKIETAEDVIRVANRVQGWLLSEDCKVVAAYDGDVAVGFIAVEPGAFLGARPTRSMKILGFYVSASNRHGVVGQKLLRAAYSLVRDGGYHVTQAVVVANNGAMRGQLERNGYRLVAAVYERKERPYEFNQRTEAEQEVHGPSGVEPQSGAVGHEREPAIPCSAAACDELRKEPDLVST